MRSRHEEISVMSVSESLEDREENRIFDVCPLLCIQATLVLVHKTFFRKVRYFPVATTLLKKPIFGKKAFLR